MAWSSNNNSSGEAAAGRRRRPVVVAGPSLAIGQGKASKTGPGQTKPRLGTTGKPAKPRQVGSRLKISRFVSLQADLGFQANQ